MTISGLISTRLASHSLHQPVELGGQVDELLDLLVVEAEPVSQLARLVGLQAGARIDRDAEDLFGRLGSDFLDVHAAGCRGDERDALAGAVDEQAQVQFAVDLAARLHIDLVDRHALRAALLGDELGAEHGPGQLANLLGTARELHAAGLAAPAGVDLGLDHPDLATDTPRSRSRLGRGRWPLRRTGPG